MKYYILYIYLRTLIDFLKCYTLDGLNTKSHIREFVTLFSRKICYHGQSQKISLALFRSSLVHQNTLKDARAELNFDTHIGFEFTNLKFTRKLLRLECGGWTSRFDPSRSVEKDRIRIRSEQLDLICGCSFISS